jgi:hypothetical protein
VNQLAIEVLIATILARTALVAVGIVVPTAAPIKSEVRDNPNMVVSGVYDPLIVI